MNNKEYRDALAELDKEVRRCVKLLRSATASLDGWMRCRTCEHALPGIGNEWTCARWKIAVYSDYFCSRWEEK